MANVVTNPTADQTIQSFNLLPASGNTTQSLGTSSAPWEASLDSADIQTAVIQNLNSVLNAADFMGSDIGAQVNAAYLALPPTGGMIFVPSGSYSFSTPIVFGTLGKPVVLYGTGVGTTLDYTPSNGTAITFDCGFGGTSSITARGLGLQNITFNGPGGSSSTAIGLQFGGANTSVTHVTETAASVVTLAITGGSFALGDVVTFSGLTTATWLNGQTATLTSASPSQLIFTDPTSHGAQPSHAETGTVTETTTANGAQGFKADGCKIGNFNQCIVLGSNTWGTEFHNCSIVNGFTNLLLVPSTVSNSGESLSFVACTFINNGGSGVGYTFASNISLASHGADVLLVNCSVDQAQINISAGLFKFTNLHMETDDAISGLTFITATAWIMGTGLSLISGSASTTGTNAVVLNGSSCHILGFDFTASSVFTNCFSLQGATDFTLGGNIFSQATNLFSFSGFTGRYVINRSDTSTPLTIGGAPGRDLAVEIRNDNGSGQSWAFDSLNDGSLSIFPKTTAAQLTLDGSPTFLSNNLTVNGKIGSYNGVQTAGNGVPSEVNQVLATGLTGNYSGGAAVTLFTPTIAGMSRITFSQAMSRAATTSSTFPSLTLKWTDASGVARTKTLVSTSSVNTTAVESDGSAIIYTNGSTLVTITSAGYASVGATSMAYELAVTAEAL